jgi:hypothetical protein
MTSLSYAIWDVWGGTGCMAAMAKASGDQLKRHEKVVAAVDLPGVPAGTPGKVFLVSGFTWVRYRVRFENGAEIGTLDRDVLMRRADWVARERQRRLEERQAQVG